MINITEKDLFTYVFYPENLSEDKLEFISNNNDKYKYEIDLLLEIKLGLEQNVPDSIIDKIHLKIREQSLSEDILLDKMNKINNPEFLILAADSPSSFLKTKTDTYKDSTNQFIGKVITSNDSNKIYFFSKNIYEKSQLEITILPSQDIFNIALDGMPIIISPKKIIDQIKIKIIN